MNLAQFWKQLRKPLDLKSMPRMKARVEIAKDVIAGIAVGKLTPQRSGYLNLSLYTGVGYPHKKEAQVSLRDKIPALTKCQACAVGSVLLAVVARDNKLLATVYEDGTITATDNSREGFLGPLASYFTHSELAYMEAAFEGQAHAPLSTSAEDDFTLRKFARVFRPSVLDDFTHDSHERVKQLMQSIIDNKGKLCLPGTNTEVS